MRFSKLNSPCIIISQKEFSEMLYFTMRLNPIRNVFLQVKYLFPNNKIVIQLYQMHNTHK